MTMGAFKTIPVTALLTGIFVPLLAAGGRSKNEQKAAEQVNRTAADKGQAPDYDGLIEEYQNVLAGNQHNLGVVYGYDRKDYARAITYWEQLLRVSPKHPEAEHLQTTMAQFKKAIKQRAN